jgi:hypothetical protein
MPCPGCAGAYLYQRLLHASSQQALNFNLQDFLFSQPNVLFANASIRISAQLSIHIIFNMTVIPIIQKLRLVFAHKKPT